MGGDSFRYFQDPDRYAAWEKGPCEVCGGSRCLTGIYFDGDAPEAVCLDCLVTGRVVVEIPSDVQDALAQSMAEKWPQRKPEEITAEVAPRVEELSRTPPVPWIQHNEWPVCDGDFAVYVGEWSQEDFTAASPTGEGLAYLLSLLSWGPGPEQAAGIWDGIATKWTAAYVFQCSSCARRLAVVQSY